MVEKTDIFLAFHSHPSHTIQYIQYIGIQILYVCTYFRNVYTIQEILRYHYHNTQLNIWQYLVTLRRGRRRQVYKMMPEILVIFLSNFWIYSCEILLLQSLKLNGGASSALVLLSSPLLKDLDVRSKRKTVVSSSLSAALFLESATYSLLLIMNELDLCGTR